MEKTIDVKIDGELFKQLMSMTKTELVEKLCVVSLEATVAEKELRRLQDKIIIAESYVEQGRSMIEAVMERWHEYDL